jgi:hypothetical protein
MSIKVAAMIPETINIESAKQVGDFVLRLSFDDGTVQMVDFKPFLSSSCHPDIRAYLEPARFAAFRVEGDTSGDRPRFLSDHDIINQQ